MEREVASYSGVRAVRVSHHGGHFIEEHRHDWPTLTVHVAGACTEQLECGQQRISGPSAFLLPAGHCHSNKTDRMGLETFGLVFDPAWLKAAGFNLSAPRPVAWLGGTVAHQAQKLASLWASKACEVTLASSTKTFFEMAFEARPLPRPPWLTSLQEQIVRDPKLTTNTLAEKLGLHPAWLARAYRLAVGEGLQDTLRRRRVEHACELIRSGKMPLVEVSVDAGFCDQAHMNRCFQKVIGRTPKEVFDNYHSADP